MSLKTEQNKTTSRAPGRVCVNFRLGIHPQINVKIKLNMFRIRDGTWIKVQKAKQ